MRYFSKNSLKLSKGNNKCSNSVRMIRMIRMNKKYRLTAIKTSGSLEIQISCQLPGLLIGKIINCYFPTK